MPAADRFLEKSRAIRAPPRVVLLFDVVSTGGVACSVA